jgi:dCMP deaminase
MNIIDTMREVYRHADLYSDDPSTRNAAYLVRGGEVVARGANKFPEGVLRVDTRAELLTDRDRKLVHIEHAERCAIYDAASIGVRTKGTTMVCPWACCAPCARAIVMAGIVQVVAHKQILDRTPERWWKEIADGMGILKSGGVEFIPLDAEIGNIKNLFNGEVWLP